MCADASRCADASGVSGGCPADGSLAHEGPVQAAPPMQDGMHMHDTTSQASAAAQEAANAVSQLQEYVQGCSSFTPHTKILTWTFDQQLENETSLQFCATVSFAFNSIPHHFCGGWQSSKKKAQRDTAERVRTYLARSFDPSGQGHTAAATARHRAAVDPGCLPEAAMQELLAVFESSGTVDAEAGHSSGEPVLRWNIDERAASDGAAEPRSQCFRATVTFYIHVVPHHFAGGWCESAPRAKADAAERVLWYFGKRAEGFAVTERPVIAAATPAPAPAASVDASRAAVEDKTIIMQVQNALQKSFSKETPPGQRVWVWDYDADEADPQLFRARVEANSLPHKPTAGASVIAG